MEYPAAGLSILSGIGITRTESMMANLQSDSSYRDYYKY